MDIQKKQLLMGKDRICLVEPCHSHEEVLYPWIELLRGQYDISVVAPQSLLNVDLLRETATFYNAAPYINALPKSRVWRLLGIFHRYVAILKTVDRIDPAVVIFNSVPTLLDAVLVACLFGKHRKIQVIHNFQNYLSPAARVLYRAFDGNLLISEQVYRYVKEHHPEFENLDYVLPIFFDGFLKSVGVYPTAVRQDAQGLKLGVFGAIEDERRNYRGLLRAIREIVATTSRTNFRVYLAGKASPKIQTYIKEHKLENVVMYYTEFVPFLAMFQLLAEMDMVLFLIDGEVKNSKYYNKYKISGTSTLMKAFKKAGVSSTDFSVDESLFGRCFFYSGTDIKSFLDMIDHGKINIMDIRKKVETCKGGMEFSFEQQQARLFSMIQRVKDKK